MRIQSNGRLYLDIDGVLIAPSSPFERVPLNEIESYAPRVTQRLGSTALELVWLSTWEKEAMQLSATIEALRDCRYLQLGPQSTTHTAIERKTAALIDDQNKAPSPFVWVDDEITEEAKQQIAVNLVVPSLFVIPDSEVGLLETDLLEIEQFASTYVS